MQMKNNYDIEWEQAGELGNGIFNREMGKITKISSITETIEACFDRKNSQIQFPRVRPNRTLICNNSPQITRKRI